CELDEQREGLVGDPVLGVVEVEAGALGREPLASCRVLREEVAQVAVSDLAVMLLERGPGRAFPQCRHVASAADCVSMIDMRSVQDSTKLVAASVCNFAASASMSIPAAACAASVASASPPSVGIAFPTCPWS